MNSRPLESLYNSRSGSMGPLARWKVGAEVPVHNLHSGLRLEDSRGGCLHMSIRTLISSNNNSSPSITAAMPIIAIVGRPNVGKSTLFNRIVGSRRAIVGDEPGITRDRLYGQAEWRGRLLRVADTGGILPEDKDFIPAEIFRQAKVALQEADAVVMIVDGRTELAAPDIET